ncbi:hypothetical protein ACF09L_19030 [Streptomyces sp. NPDC014779]|uniref:hypothetical protein n=1 Tax=Streptomyces sp. NPDC014779 TaxID=3364911 RepID=UPI0036F9FBC7
MSAPRRRALLLAAIRDWQGEWTTTRVQKLYRSRAYAVPMRKTARDDLAQLHRQGLLVLDERDPNRRVYRLNRITTGGAG